ncbi:MAG: hypothetical protein C0467_03250 [Planctomycetaceae bacterium]|nr:hypothetical protein [Planctomycetaceae bacterium]
MLFYWWPIWVLGYIMALVTYFEDHRLAILPAATTVVESSTASEKGFAAYTLTVKEPITKSLEQAARATSTPGDGAPFKTRISQKAWLGPLFCVVLLITVLITNVPLRGVWSFVVLLMLVVLALVITLVPNGWDNLLAAVGNLHIHINLAGYLFIATAVLILWVVSVFIFDQRTYMRVTPGHIAICEHIGASIRDINGDRVEVEKKRDDMFRHWLLGFFSGDIVLRLTDSKEEIRLPNVLWIGWRIEQVQRLIREKTTVSRTT